MIDDRERLAIDLVEALEILDKMLEAPDISLKRFSYLDKAKNHIEKALTDIGKLDKPKQDRKERKEWQKRHLKK